MLHGLVNAAVAFQTIVGNLYLGHAKTFCYCKSKRHASIHFGCDVPCLTSNSHSVIFRRVTSMQKWGNIWILSPFILFVTWVYMLYEYILFPPRIQMDSGTKPMRSSNSQALSESCRGFWDWVFLIGALLGESDPWLPHPHCKWEFSVEALHVGVGALISMLSRKLVQAERRWWLEAPNTGFLIRIWHIWHITEPIRLPQTPRLAEPVPAFAAWLNLHYIACLCIPLSLLTIISCFKGHLYCICIAFLKLCIKNHFQGHGEPGAHLVKQWAEAMGTACMSCLSITVYTVYHNGTSLHAMPVHYSVYCVIKIFLKESYTYQCITDTLLLNNAILWRSMSNNVTFCGLFMAN